MPRLYSCAACGFLSTVGEAYARVKAENGRRVRVCTECAEQYGHAVTVTSWINQAACRLQEFDHAMDTLLLCHSNATVGELYDKSPAVAAAINVVVPDFEYPDWTSRRISEVVAMNWEKYMVK